MRTPFKSYPYNPDGGLSLWFALALSVLIVGSGAAIDMINMQTNQQKMQDAIDSAVLVAALHSGTKKEKKAAGREAFSANFRQNMGLSKSKLKLKISPKGIVTGTAEADQSLIIMDILGASNPSLKAKAVAGGSGSSRTLEVALVLDYSSSMNGQFRAMSQAARELINSLTDEGARKNVKIALVPFAQEVYASMDGHYILNGVTGISWTGCTMSRDWPYVTSDQTPTLDYKSKWGLLGSDYNETTDTGYYDHCSRYLDRNLVVKPLSTDHRATKSQLRAMRPYEGTNVTVGINFGYQVLSPNAPWTEGAAFGSKTEKYMILLSDGEHDAEGFGAANEYSDAQGLENLISTCTAAKNSGITIVSIAYETDDEDDVLKTCASDESNYFESNENDINQVFEKIGRDIEGESDTYLIQ